MFRDNFIHSDLGRSGITLYEIQSGKLTGTAARSINAAARSIMLQRRQRSGIQ
jgi:hypothetical protein